MGRRNQRRLSPRDARWAATRAGSHAGRGFRYQDEAATHLAVEVWLGRDAHETITPEGLEDIGLGASTGATHAQVKSRRELRGSFAPGDLRSGIESLAAALLADPGSVGALLLEREIARLPSPGFLTSVADVSDLAAAIRALLPASVPTTEVEPLLRRLRVVALGSVALADQAAIADALGLPAGAAVLPYLALRSRLADAADQNGISGPEDAVSLSRTDIDRILRDAAAHLDVDGMTRALARGALEPLDFLTALQDPSFFDGVDVRPGHVAAGLVVERLALLDEIEGHLGVGHPVLVVGPSGAGKSAIVWSAAARMRGRMLWYRVRRLGPDDVADVARFVRAAAQQGRPTIGLAVDDLGNGAFDGWDELVEELSFEGATVPLLAAIREEDLVLVASAPRLRQVRPTLDEPLARLLFEELEAAGRTQWPAWREPFEQSRGLLLEYVHLLTSGERLEVTVAGQLARRQREPQRQLELVILRYVATAASLDTPVPISVVRQLSRRPDDEIHEALERLVNEHLLVRAGGDRYTGTHVVRSQTIARLIHQPPPPVLAETVAELLGVVPPEELERLAGRALIGQVVPDGAVVEALAGRVRHDPGPAVLVSAARALRTASARRVAVRWRQVLEARGVPPHLWRVMVMSAVIRQPFPMMSEEHGRVATELTDVAFAGLVPDFVEALGDEVLSAAISACTNAGEAATVLSLIGSLEPRTARRVGEACLRLAAIGSLEERADLLAELHGLGRHAIGEASLRELSAALIADIPRERPFTDDVVLEETSDGLVVKGGHHALASTGQGKPDAPLIELSQLLARAVPQAAVVHVRVLDATGDLASPYLEKRIPRANLPSTAAVAENRRLMHEFDSLTAGAMWTPRILAETELVARLSRLLPRLVETWHQGGRPAQAQAVELGRLFELARTLPASPLDDTNDGEPDPGTVEGLATLVGGGGDVDGPRSDRVAAMLVGLTRLPHRLYAGELPAPIAAYVLNTLLPGVRQLRRSARWRFSEPPPTAALTSMERTLADLYAVLQARQLPGVAGRRLPPTLAAAARVSRERGDRHLQSLVEAAADVLHRAGDPGTIVTRPLDELRANDWPSVDVAAFVEIEDAFSWLSGPSPTVLAALRPLADRHRRVVTVPVCQGQALVELSGVLIQTWHPMPAEGKVWRQHAPVPFLNDPVAGAYRACTQALIEASALISIARGGELLSAETEALTGAIAKFDGGRTAFREHLEGTANPLVHEAADVLEQLRARVAQEAQSSDAGAPMPSVASEIGAAVLGRSPSELANKVVGFGLALLEYDLDPVAAERRVAAAIDRLAPDGEGGDEV